MNIEQKSGIGLGFLAQAIFTAHDDEFLAQIADSLDHSDRIEMSRTSQVDVKDLLSVPDQPTQIDRQDNLLFGNAITKRTSGNDVAAEFEAFAYSPCYRRSEK